MKSNIGKCHLLVNTSDKDNIRVGNFDIYIIANAKNSYGLTLIINSPLTTLLLSYAKQVVEKFML